MNDAPILPDDEPVSLPSVRTMRGGDPATLGRIDHYDLLRKLGGGGFGVVYLARDAASGVEVALKTLHPLLKRNAEEMDLLREKFRLVHGLTHPNIAKALVIHLVREINVWDAAARAELRLSPGDSVMVMDYAPGVTLSKWRRQFPGGVVPPDLALEVGRQVAAALDYAHSERIVHRDVKPGNIMVETVDGGRLRARLLDFGLAAEIRSSMSRVSTETGDTSGTRPYMPPEQWLGRKQDGRTDQYALACVLYELLSGAPPFAGVFETGDPVIMRTAVTTDPPEEIEGCDPAVNAALLKALAKNPKDRFPSCTEFVDALLPASGMARSPSTPQSSPSARSENAPSHSSGDVASSEVDVFRRMVALTRTVAAIPAEDRANALFGPSVNEVETELAAIEEALKWNRFAAAVQCLDRAEVALSKLAKTKEERETHAALGMVQIWEGGPYWATKNIGAEKPEDFGLYFWWGDTVGYRREGNAWVASDGSNQNFSFDEKHTQTFGKDNEQLRRDGWSTPENILAPAHDAAHIHWGGDWRIPTRQELFDLDDKCDWTWTTRNGVNGYVVRGRDYFANASIFLPAAGYGRGTSIGDAGSGGYYWSPIPGASSSDFARDLEFGADGHHTYGSYRFDGLSVRPVQGFAK